MRYFLLVFGLCVVAVMGVFGKRGDMSRRPPIQLFPDMERQPKLRPQTETQNLFWTNNMSSRLPVDGTIARGSLYEDTPVNTGRITGTTNFVETNPLPLTRQLLERGRERYQISCAPCHGALGDGKGITTQYGMTVVANLHDTLAKRIVQWPDGQIFNTITYGSVSLIMGPYGANISGGRPVGNRGVRPRLATKSIGNNRRCPDRQTRIIEKVAYDFSRTYRHARRSITRSIRVAQTALYSDRGGRSAGIDRSFREYETVCVFLPAGIHVLPESLPRRIVSGVVAPSL